MNKINVAQFLAVSLVALPGASFASDPLTRDFLRSTVRHADLAGEAFANYNYWVGKNPTINADIYKRETCSELNLARFFLLMAENSMGVGEPTGGVTTDSPEYIAARAQVFELIELAPCN